ncbi:hypothetical protein [Nitrosomonas ureae]|uniref:hypothetical protein n=1 Tax=Nitrosomonas ureae TaxID=44577 RepID=UPI000D76853B|nr:hypothetical protein [Nitrosomonas ureae]
MLKIKKHSKHCLQRSVRLLISLVLLTGIIGLTGCAGIHFYNPDNDATASLVKKSSDEINFKAVIEEERKNQAKLLDHELEVVGRFALALRNTRMRSLLEHDAVPGTLENGSLIRNLESKIDKRLLRFINKNQLDNIKDSNNSLDNLLKDISNNINDFNDTLENLNVNIKNFKIALKTSAPECEEGDDAKFVVDDEMIKKYSAVAKSIKSDLNVTNLLQDFKKSCETHQGIRNKFDASMNAMLGEEHKANNYLEEQEKDKSEKEDIYKRVLEAYQEALKQAETDASEAVTKNITTKANELKVALNALEESGIFGKQSAVNHQIKSIDLILDVLAEGKLNEEKLNCSEIKIDDKVNETDAQAQAKKKCLDAKQQLGVVAQLPGFSGRLATIEERSKLPPVNALLFEKERLMTLKEGVEKQIGRTKSKIALLQQKREATIDEIDSLIKVKQHLSWAQQANRGNDIKLSDLYQKSINESARRHMVIAITRYLNTSIGPEQVIREIQYRLIDIEHAQALDASETALRLWEVAIKQPINVLAAYHGSGMKREELAKLIIEALKAAGLFTIAGGVLN